MLIDAHRVALAELNTNVATTVRHPRENDDNVPASSVRQRRSILLPIILLHGFSPPSFLSPGLPPPDLPPDLFLPNFLSSRPRRLSFNSNASF